MRLGERRLITRSVSVRSSRPGERDRRFEAALEEARDARRESQLSAGAQRRARVVGGEQLESSRAPRQRTSVVARAFGDACVLAVQAPDRDVVVRHPPCSPIALVRRDGVSEELIGIAQCLGNVGHLGRVDVAEAVGRGDRVRVVLRRFDDGARARRRIRRGARPPPRHRVFAGLMCVVGDSRGDVRRFGTFGQQRRETAVELAATTEWKSVVGGDPIQVVAERDRAFVDVHELVERRPRTPRCQRVVSEGVTEEAQIGVGAGDREIAEQ